MFEGMHQVHCSTCELSCSFYKIKLQIPVRVEIFVFGEERHRMKGMLNCAPTKEYGVLFLTAVGAMLKLMWPADI